MLQQTQVGTVIPYYDRFIRAFPSLASLARARLERVLELWSGLGYYRRAQNLHRAARIIAQEFGGRFPREFRVVRALPGVGDYTAKAVLSIAFNRPYSALDGNVARVVARLRAVRGSLGQPRFRRAIERNLHRSLSRRQPGNFNQALMELGQTVCLPRAPRCPVCPVQTWCRAYRLGRPERFPSPRPRRKTESHFLATAVIRRGHKSALVRGLDEGLLGELWNFPSALGKSRAEALTRLQEKLSGMTRGTVRIGEPLAELRHGITYRSISVHLYPVAVRGRFARQALRWFALDRLHQSAVSQLARKIAKNLAQR